MNQIVQTLSNLDVNSRGGCLQAIQLRNLQIPEKSQTMICLKQIVILAVMAIALFGRLTEAGFRCSVVGGFLNIFSGEARSAACSASCVTLGHTSGICASDGECQ